MTYFITAVLMIMFAAFSRLLPHPANFAPVAAIALFSGVYVNRKFALAVPAAAMLLSDMFLGFHSQMVWVYGSFALITIAGIFLKKKMNERTGKKLAYIFGTTLFSSVVFFIVTNFGVWTGGYYGPGINGLIECYVAAVPFFRNSLAGDVFYVAVMFGIYGLLNKYLFKAAGEIERVK